MEEPTQYLLIDEYRGRLIADSYGIKVVGVLGVLIQAKQQDILLSVKTSVEKLIEIGFRLDKKTG
ncbi:MAG: DUF3368 domain-containing protein [Bacteroidia bacterium]